MSVDDEMTLDERRKYLRRMQKRFGTFAERANRRASRPERSRLVDEMEAITGLHRSQVRRTFRKSLIRLVNGDLARKPRRKHRGCSYGGEVQGALEVIAEALDYLCAERLQPNLLWMAEHLASHGELELSPPLHTQLARISPSTVRRLLRRMGQDRPRLPRRGPEEANRFRRQIPARRIPWDEKEPGHFEADLVHHCGVSASGQYLHTLQLVDVATGWSERASTLGRSYRVMEDSFRRILDRLPFPVVEIHPDNDSAFFNAHLYRFFKDLVTGPRLSRSRAWHKNDNRFVEQKNSTLVRAYTGYDRLDTVEQTNLLNHLYDKLWLYYNFFQPVMRLEEKVVWGGEEGRHRVRRRYDRARTPLDRLCASGVLGAQTRRQLEELRRRTNPRKLRGEIQELLEELYDLPCATEGQTEDIYQTLFTSPRKEGGEGLPVLAELASLETLSIGRTIPVR